MTRQKRNIRWEPYFLDDYGLEENYIRDAETEDIEDIDSDFAKKLKDLPRIVITPFGPYRVDDTSNPLKRFEFWIGHTNFRIGKRAFSVLNTMPGVEALMITTPYRFIVACAQMFNFSDVRVNIERMLCGKHMIDAYLSQINDEKTLQEVRKCLEAIKGNKYWSMYIMPNGYIHSFNTENRQEFISNCHLLSEAREMSNGILITSEDDYNHAPNLEVQRDTR